MDHAERGTVEKTLDELIHQDQELSQSLIRNVRDTISEQDDINSDEAMVLAGIVSGILSTIRTYANESTGIDEEDIDEILQIVRRREQEFLELDTESNQSASAP